jgi:hypothetical protein
LGERNELLRERDAALGERNELLRQRDLAIGLANLQTERLGRRVHRSDMSARRAAIARQAGRFIGTINSTAATRDCILLFLYLANAGGETLIDVFIRNLETKDFLVVDRDEVQASGLGTWSSVAIEKALGACSRPKPTTCVLCGGPIGMAPKPPCRSHAPA